jgi:peptidoglycan/LPS O-acetylase OafA/YrhL
MMYHFCFWRNGNVALDSDVLNSAWRFGWVGVEIFFTISGFVIAFSAENATPRQFALSRAIRLAPTIWICATISLLATIFLSTEPHPNLLNEYVFTILLRPVGNHIDIVYWTLTVEIAFYLFVFMLIRLKDFNFMLIALLCVGLVSSIFDILLLAIQSFHHGTPHYGSKLILELSNKHTSRLLLLHHGVFFALGSLIWCRLTAYRPKGYLLIACALIAGSTAEVFYTTRAHAAQYPLEQFSTLTAPVAWLAGLSLIFLGSLRGINSALQAPAIRKALRAIGLLTFPLYLLHNNLGIFMRERFLAYFQSNAIATSLAAILCLFISYLVSAKLDPPLAGAIESLIRKVARSFSVSRGTSRIWNCIFYREFRS